MNRLKWLRSSFRKWLGLNSPTPAPPVVPPPSPAPMVAPRASPVLAPSTNVIVPRVTPLESLPVQSIVPSVPVVQPAPVIVPQPAPPMIVPPPVPVQPPMPVVWGRGVFGVSHVNEPAETVSRGVLDRVAKVQANHLMGFATGNPLPSRGGPFDWTDIDPYMNRMRNAQMSILVANSAPGWMMLSGQDYDMNSRLKREFFPQYAQLVVAYLERFPWVKAVVVWNEMKGFGVTENGRWHWDYRLYCELYNLVYDAVKAVRPDVLMGGPYMVLDSWSTASVMSDPSSTWRGEWGVGDQRVLDSYNFWRENARGFDWVAFDFGPNHKDRDALFTDSRCLDKAIDFMKWCRTWTEKPLGCMETYPDPGNGSSEQDCRELYGLLLQRMRQEVRGESFALIWNQRGFRPSLDPGLVSVLDRVQSGQA